MDEAFVEDAENDIDGEDGGEDEVGLGFEGGLEGLEGAGELAVHGLRHAELLLEAFYGFGGIAEGDAGGEIEGDGDRGEEAGMVHGQG